MTVGKQKKKKNLFAIFGKINVKLVYCYHGTAFKDFLRIIISLNISFSASNTYTEKKH